MIGTTGGTTVSQFIRLLRGRDDLTVVTNALDVAIDLVGSPGPRVFVAGGEVRGSSQESVGLTAEAFLAATTSTSRSSASTGWTRSPAAPTTTRSARG